MRRVKITPEITKVVSVSAEGKKGFVLEKVLIVTVYFGVIVMEGQLFYVSV